MGEWLNTSLKKYSIILFFVGLLFAGIFLTKENIQADDSPLPVLYIESDTDYYGVDREYVKVKFRLTGDGYDASQLYEGEAEIRLRGNSTAGLAKRPFKVKLKNKTDLLGMGENKHWVLLANAIDVSMLRNQLLQDFAENLGMDAMKSQLVTLMYNGEYYGVYELSEHVRVDSSRVDIFDWEEALEDGVPEETLPNKTGGVLMEMDFYAFYGEQPANLMTAYSLPIYINTPEDTTELKELVNYMNKYVQAMEYALHSTDFIYENADTHYQVQDQGWYDWKRERRIGVTYSVKKFSSDRYDGWHYTEFLDMDSAINNMLVCEFAMNWDSMKNSFFMYKDIDGKIVFGPVWDFDWAWGNSMGQDTNAPETWQTTNEWFANEWYYQTVQWNRLLIRDPYFVVRLYERYHEIRDEYLAPIVNEQIKAISEENREEGLANVERWNGAFSATAGQSYNEQVNYIQNFLNRRLVWLDEQFASVETLMDSLGYYVTSDAITTKGCDTESEERYTVLTVSVTDEAIKQISFQVNGTHMYRAEVVDGSAVVTIPDEALEKEDGVLNVVQYRALDENGNYLINRKGTIEGNYENAISNYYTFVKTIENVTVEKKSIGNSDNYDIIVVTAIFSVVVLGFVVVVVNGMRKKQH